TREALPRASPGLYGVEGRFHGGWFRIFCSDIQSWRRNFDGGFCFSCAVRGAGVACGGLWRAGESAGGACCCGGSVGWEVDGVAGAVGGGGFPDSGGGAEGVVGFAGERAAV